MSFKIFLKIFTCVKQVTWNFMLVGTFGGRILLNYDIYYLNIISLGSMSSFPGKYKNILETFFTISDKDITIET